VTVVVHAADSGYSLQGYAPDGFSAKFGKGYRPNLGVLHLTIERAIYDFLGSIMVDRIFERFPNVRLASVENGSTFLGDLFKKLRSASTKLPVLFKVDPVELFRQNVWINPFWEDDVRDTVELMGADRVIFGSDWPHIEGMERPLDYLAELKVFSDTDRQRILLDNTLGLNSRRPA
jgi:predicted TIM-barrel fold metal-dependent hydrolase